MNVDQLLECGRVLGLVAKNFSNLPTEAEKAANAALTLATAQIVITELASHLARGVDPYEAMEATARGELELAEPAATVFALLTAKPRE